MLATRIIVLFLALLAVVWSGSYAADPDPLQDFCVGINHPNAHAGNQIYNCDYLSYYTSIKHAFMF